MPLSAPEYWLEWTKNYFRCQFTHVGELIHKETWSAASFGWAEGLQMINPPIYRLTTAVSDIDQTKINRDIRDGNWLSTLYSANNANFPLSQEGKKLLDRMQSPRRPPGVSQSGSAVADLRFFERLGWHYPPPLPLAMSMSDYFHLTLEIYPSSLTTVLCGANTRTLGFCRRDQGGRMISDLDFPAFYLRNWHFLHKCGGVHLHPRLQDDISAAEWKFQNQMTCLGQKLPCYL